VQSLGLVTAEIANRNSGLARRCDQAPASRARNNSHRRPQWLAEALPSSNSGSRAGLATPSDLNAQEPQRSDASLECRERRGDRIKTDRRDTERLARLLAAGELRFAFVGRGFRAVAWAAT